MMRDSFLFLGKRIMAFFKAFLLILLSIIFSLFFIELLSFSLIKLGIKNINIHSWLQIQTQYQNQKNNLAPFEHPTSIDKLKLKNPSPGSNLPVQTGFINYFSDIKEVDGLIFPESNSIFYGGLRENNKVIYSYSATIDSEGRRITSNFKTNKKFQKHFVIMGCSFVFGSGLKDQDTLPWQIQKKMPQYKSYNLSFPGYGPNSILARALNFNFFSKINPSEGIAVYIYINDHVNRSLGIADRNSIINWRANLAYLEETSPFKFEFKGSMKSNMPLRYKISSWLTNSYTASLFLLNFPIIFESDVARFVRQIKAIKTEYLKNTNENNKFYFVFYPASPDNDPHQALIIKYLNKYEIDYLNYSGTTTLKVITNKPILLPDSHPNGHANDLFSELLKNDIPK